MTFENKQIARKDIVWIKTRLETLENKKKSLWIYMLFVLIGLVVIFVSIHFFYNNSYIHNLSLYETIFSVSLGSFVFLFLTIYWNLSLDVLITKHKREIVFYEMETINDEIEEDIYENSIRMSYKYLDQYYLQTREQAQKGFGVTVSISIGGALIIAIGILEMYTGKGDPAYITTASGVITEFIAAIFFYLYNKTIQSMGDYHNKLVLSQNVSIALKVSESLTEDKKETAKIEIIRELVKDINHHVNYSKDIEKYFQK